MSPSEESEHGRWGNRFGLRWRLLTLVAGLSLVPLLTAILIGYLSSRHDVEQLSLEALDKSAKATALQGEVLIEEKRKLVPSIVAGNRHLQTEVDAMIGRFDGAGADADPTPLQEHLSAKADRSEHALEYYVLSAEGTLLGSSRPDEEPGGIRRDSCWDNRDEAAPGAPFVEYEPDEPAVLVGYPIRGDDPEAGAFFCGRFGFDIAERLPRWEGSALAEANVHLVGPGGRTVWSRGAGGDFQADELLEQVDESNEWLGVTTSDGQGRSLAAVHGVEGAPWYVATQIPEQQALASLLELRRGALLVAGGFGLVVLVGTFALVGRMVRPVERLVEATEAMQAGELDQSVEPSGPPELAQLADAFNEMSREVSEVQATLEERVAERTDELQRQQQFIELIFDSMEQNLIVVDENLRILKANEAARQTYDSEMIGRTCYAAFRDRESVCEDCPVPPALRKGEPFETERVHHCGSDGPEIVSFQGVPLPGNGADESSRFLLISRIVTEERQRERQMVHNEKMAAFAQLAAGTAHEIGNPLASIKSQVQLAKQSDDSDVVEETLDVVDNQVRRTERLLREMSDFARRRTSSKAELNVNRVVEDTVRLLIHDPRSQDAELATDLSPGLPTVYGDEDRLMQVILNLGINGLDAVEQQGTVSVETHRLDEHVVVRVTNDGPPIPREIRDRIFDPYFTTKPRGEGTGLGLFVSRRLVEQMNGSLQLEQSCPDAGTSFAITLPVTEPADATNSGR